MVSVTAATPEQCADAACRRRRAADAYRPDVVRLLLVGQMPPAELDRYFYFARVPRADYLFRAVVPHFLGEAPARQDKRAQLAALQELGVFLIDLKPDPCDPETLPSFVDDLVDRARDIDPAEVILIKVDVYDNAFAALREAGISVVDERLPFPSTGRQKEFCRGFAAALVQAGWTSHVARPDARRIRGEG